MNDNLPKDLVSDTYSLPISPYNLVDMCVISQRNETGAQHYFLVHCFNILGFCMKITTANVISWMRNVSVVVLR